MDYHLYYCSGPSYFFAKYLPILVRQYLQINTQGTDNSWKHKQSRHILYMMAQKSVQISFNELIRAIFTKKSVILNYIFHFITTLSTEQDSRIDPQPKVLSYIIYSGKK